MVERRMLLLLGSIAASTAVLLYCYHPRRRRSSLWWRQSPPDPDPDPKPQRNFKLILADNSAQPFVHLCRQQNADTVQLHPFHCEIRSLLESAGSLPSVVSTEAGPPRMTEPYISIETKDELIKLAEILSKEQEFAVDTEQHSLRSYLGFTALVQVSTRKQDFLIDAIALHDDMGILQIVFADPGIRKVFHGADSDILWLQRDFHIYVVNLFDTVRACDVLGKPQRSLAYLLQNYCGIVTNKVFQRADWRLRPLPEEMIEYARIDAHYLLYIADCLQNELLLCRSGESSQQYPNKATTAASGSTFEECMRRSNMICLQLYEKDGTSGSPATVAASLASRFPKEDERSQRILYALCEWRDAIARSEDDSPRFVLSDRAILALCEQAPLTIKRILDTVSMADLGVPGLDVTQYMTPLTSPSPVLLQNATYLQSLFQHSQKESISGTKCVVDLLSDLSKKRKGFINSILDFCSLSNNVNLSSHVDESEEYKDIHVERVLERKIPRQWKVGDFETSRKRFVKKFSCKAPVYHNCRIYAGDGRLLCYCDHKKLDWYVQRELAEFVDEYPPAIKLLFEPKGRPEDENNEFYIQSKTNRCVGCGESSHYLRYRVIPSCYRQHFPEHLKSHRSHDIVLLCVDCHEIAHRAAEMHKKQVALDYGVPLFARRVVDNENEAEIVVDGRKGGASPLQLRTAAMALLRHGSSMPKKRIDQLEEVLQAYYGRKNISQEDVLAALLVGKGPRELRRLRKKKGLVLDNVSKIGKDALRTDGEMDNLESQNPGDRILKVENDVENLCKKDGRKNSLASEVLDNLTVNILCNEVVFRNGQYEASSAESESAHKDAALSSDFVAEDLNEKVKDDAIVSRDMISAAIEEHGHDSLADGAAIVYWSNGTHSNDECFSVEEVDSTACEGTVTENISAPRHSETSLLYHKPSQNISFLGHGPHGKKVVGILLEQEGEDGIRHFCQRWRAVFVEAVKPSYLPAGWDISHSGHREFGEYSVYNPQRKAVVQNK